MAKQHWTAENAEAFAHRIAFDFIAQVEKKLEAIPMTQAELAKRLGVSKGSVSQVLNNPQNLTLKTISRYAQALGMKASIVAYEDGDPENQGGPIPSAVFENCWERAGKPRDVWGANRKRLMGSDSLVIDTAKVNPRRSTVLKHSKGR